MKKQISLRDIALKKLRIDEKDINFKNLLDKEEEKLKKANKKSQLVYHPAKFKIPSFLNLKIMIEVYMIIIKEMDLRKK